MLTYPWHYSWYCLGKAYGEKNLTVIRNKRYLQNRNIKMYHIFNLKDQEDALINICLLR